MTLSDMLTQELPRYVEKLFKKMNRVFSPYVEFRFHEFTDHQTLQPSEAYSAIETYLSSNCCRRAKRLKVDVPNHVGRETDQPTVRFTMDAYEEVTDEFRGVKVWWNSDQNYPRIPSFTLYPGPDEKRFYTLSSHKRHRDLISDIYIDHVLSEGRKIAASKRQRKLYTNNVNSHQYCRSKKWSYVVFDHPATFDTLAMATKAKLEIRKELIKFSKGKDYYARIGKAWKRGYLLHGPPGTGKSTMVAAMANLLNYDVYDLELTTVKDNSELRHLLIETTSKSIIVIEDIDCSLDLTGRRKKTSKEKDDDDDDGENEADAVLKKIKKEEEESKRSKVTLSGILNCIDGIWSSCGGERIFVFTTNYIDKLDPALIRRGRMDRHINMGYCCFEAFKVLAKNYLRLDTHELFPEIEILLKENNMIPADVAENLTPISDDEDDKTTCLRNLIEALSKKSEEKEEEEASNHEMKQQDSESTQEIIDGRGPTGVEEVKSNGSVTMSEEMQN